MRQAEHKEKELEWERFLRPPYVADSYQASKHTRKFLIINSYCQVPESSSNYEELPILIHTTTESSREVVRPKRFIISHYDHQPWVPVIPPSHTYQKNRQVKTRSSKPNKNEYSNIFPTRKLSFPFRKTVDRSSTRTGRRHWTPARRKPKSPKPVQVALPNLAQKPAEAQREEKRVRGIRRQGHVLADVPKEGLLSLFSLSVIGALLAL